MQRNLVNVSRHVSHVNGAIRLEGPFAEILSNVQHAIAAYAQCCQAQTHECPGCSGHSRD